MAWCLGRLRRWLWGSRLFDRYVSVIGGLWKKHMAAGIEELRGAVGRVKKGKAGRKNRIKLITVTTTDEGLLLVEEFKSCLCYADDPGNIGIFSVDLVLNFQILRSFLRPWSPGACSGSWNSLWRKQLWSRSGTENWFRWPAATPPSNLPLMARCHLLAQATKQIARPRWKIRVLKMQSASLLKQSFLLLKRRSVEMLFLIVVGIESEQSIHSNLYSW